MSESKIREEAEAAGEEATRVVDKRASSKPPTDATDAPEPGLSPQEQQELLAKQMAEEKVRIEEAEADPDKDKTSYVTAFLVVLGHDGVAMATGNLAEAANITIERTVQPSDLLKMSFEVLEDVKAGMAASATVNLMMGMQQQAQAQMQAGRAGRVGGIRG